jgi:hypothetical protein
LHRPFDGGVEMSAGSGTSLAQIIRQTRKYFRYQSGKGIQTSCGINFKPSIDLDSMRRFSSVLIECKTRRPHGLIDGLNIIVSQAENSSGNISTIYNGKFQVAVVDATTLPIHQYATSSAIPMLAITGAGENSSSNSRHDLRVHVHKYDSGAGTSYNQLSSFSQQINGDSTAAPSTTNFLSLYPSSISNQGFLDRFDVDGKRSTALYPIIIGNPIRGNAYQTTEGILLLSGQSHETGQTFYVGSARYYKFVCSHDRANRAPAFAGLVLGIPVR